MDLILKNVSKSYEKKVLNHISIDLNNVHALGIIGESGCGKSTLLRILSGIEDYEEGKCIVNGMEIHADQCREYQEQLGFVFQKHNLFPHLTLKENIILILNKIKKMPRAEAIEKAQEALEWLHLVDVMDKRPNKVSGGQAQRASIARALATNPDLIFLDEPTAALDPILTGEVLGAIKELKDSGRDFIFVTHELGFLKEFADYVIFMDQGEIVEAGDISCLEHPKTESLSRFLKGEL